MNNARLNGTRRVRQPIEEAAALRWYLARSESPDAVPHEIIEYSAAASVLDEFERRVPGLRSFVDRLLAAARLASGLRIAKAVDAPKEIVSIFDQSFASALTEVAIERAQLEIDELPRVLSAYAHICDLAGVLAS